MREGQRPRESPPWRTLFPTNKRPADRRFEVRRDGRWERRQIGEWWLDISGILSLQNRVKKKTQTLKNIDSDVGGDSSFSGLLRVRHVSRDTQNIRAVYSGRLVPGKQHKFKGGQGQQRETSQAPCQVPVCRPTCMLHSHPCLPGGRWQPPFADWQAFSEGLSYWSV